MEQADSVPRAVVGTKVPAASCCFTGTHSRGGRHGQAYPRIVAAYLHGRVRRRRHVRRNPAPLKAAVARHRRARTAWTGASAPSLASTSGLPTSPAWMIGSQPASAASACGRSRPCVSEIAPMILLDQPTRGAAGPYPTGGPP